MRYRLRVEKFRNKQSEYLANRKFRKRTGLKALRRRIIALGEAIEPDPNAGSPGKWYESRD